MFRNWPNYGAYRGRPESRLPRIPSTWQWKRLASIGRKVSASGRPDLPLLSVYLDRGVIPYAEGGRRVHAPSEQLDAYQIVRPGDLVLNNQQAWRGSVGVSDHHGIISPAYVIWRNSSAISAQYGKYLFRAPVMVDQFVMASRGVGDIQRDLHGPSLRNLLVPVPPLEDQGAIAKYLAHANARIDKAIAAKRYLIALLEEQKRALLNERMLSAPSGDLVPVKALLRPVSSAVGDSHRQKTLLSLTLRGVIPRDLENAKGKFPSDFSTYQDLRPGQFVFCLFDVDETPRTVGLSRVEGMITGAYDVFDSVDPSASEYLELFFTAMDNAKAYRPLYTGLRKVLPRDRFLRTVVPLPGEAIRQSVVGEIRAFMAESAVVIERVSREVALLQEFRARLVADVVTGQVDVRAIAESLPDSTEGLDTSTSVLDDGLEEALSEGEE